MSDAVKLETPLGDLLRKPKLKRLTSIISSYQQKQVKKIVNPTKDEKIHVESNQLIANRFLTMKRLGSGGFGEVEKETIGDRSLFFDQVYLAKDQREHDRSVALKFERTDSSRPQLPIERDVFEIVTHSIYFPQMFFFGTHNEYNVLAMEVLGPSVEDLFNFCARKFSTKTIVMIGEQCLRAIETLHERSIIHRDLKPDNFLFGLTKKAHRLHLIDFGLCKHFRHPLTFEHNAYRNGKSLTGTARYCSLNTHHGMEQSRRDDIECLAYIFIYLARGNLPWMSIKMSNRKRRNEKLSEIKGSLTSKELCDDLPEEFELFYKYSKTLSFTEKPDYIYLRNLLLSLLDRLDEKFDYVYDWHCVAKLFKENLDAGRTLFIAQK